MRHGLADESGNLSSLGALEAENILKKARSSGAFVSSIFSSPLPRAIQTAEIASRIFGKKFSVANSLKPESSPEMVSELLCDGVLIVSHKPLVSLIIRGLAGETPPIFDPATFVTVENGRLVMLIPPSHV